MTQIITSNGGGGGGNISKYVADVPYECWEGEQKAISGDKVYAKVSDMDNTLSTALQPGDNVSDLCNDAGYIDSSALSGYALACDIPTDNCQLANGCGYTTCTGTLVASDLTPYATTASLCAVATSGKYCDLTGTPTIPTDNCQLANGCGYITSGDLPDMSCYQKVCNLVTSLSGADNTHYPSAKAVADALSCAGAGDMMKSVYDPNSVEADAFDYCNFINTPTIPSVINCLTSSCTGDALSAKQGCVLNSCVTSINDKIPSEATCSNKLADKNYVDNSINSVAAYYITKNAQGDQFATYAELAAATTFYSGGVQRTPTRNDYTIVLDDETHSDEVTRYIYNSGWEYQYSINESPLTQSQLDALNSGITSAKVSCYDGVVSTVSGYGNIVTHNTSEFATSTQGGKADTALQPNDNITCLCNNAGYITGVAWGGITGCLTDQTDLCGALGGKACDSCVVHLSGAETICGTKTFCTSPVVPAKTSAATNTGTAIATEAQVYAVNQAIPTNNCQLANGCGYTTCTGTLTASDISDTAFGSSWDGDTTHAPSKNAIYDVLGDVETLLANL